MSNTIQTYVGNGTQTDFAFSFDYLRKEFVKVLVDGSEVAYTFHTPQTVKITPAPAAGKVIIIRRATDTTRLVTFVDGSVLLSADLNVAQLQAIHIAAEALAAASGSLLIDETGAYSAGFRRVANLGNPTNSRDAVTKEWSETALTSNVAQAQSARTDAQAAAAAAAASQTAAGTSATNAAADRTAAQTARTAAETAHTGAETARTQAQTAQTAAETARTAAETARNQAQTAQTAASTSATNAATSAADAAASAASIQSLPAGAVIFTAMDAPPTGYLRANGAAVSRTTFSALFTAIGTLYGAGDGSTTFNLPDLRGEFIRGWDDARGVDSGRAFGSAQGDQNKAHTHTASTSTDGAHTHTVQRTNNTGSGGTSTIGVNTATSTTTVTTSSSGDHSHTVTINSDGGSEVRVRNIALLACIKF